MAGSQCDNSLNNVMRYVVRLMVFSFLFSQVVVMLLLRNVVREDYFCWILCLNYWYFNWI